MKIEFDFTNVPQEDIDRMTKDIQSSINYIASGARDRYKANQLLEEQLKAWGRDFAAKLREHGITNRNTNYSSWEYSSSMNYTIDIFYVLSRTEFKSVDDFAVTLTTRKYSNVPESGVNIKFKQVDELIKYLIDNNLLKLKTESV